MCVDVLTHATDGRSRLATMSGVTVRSFPAVFGGLNAQSPALWAWIVAHSQQYDIVHVHSYHALGALPSTLLSRTKVVFTPHYHGTGHTPFRAWVHPTYRVIGGLMMRKAAAIICVSDPESRLVADHFPSVTDKISVIPNGVDLRRIERAAPRPRKRPFLLFVGRLEEYKQVDRVIGALPLTRGSPTS